MRKTNTALAIFLGLVLLPLVWSCQQWDNFSGAELNFDGEYATALLHAKIEVSDILGEVDSSTTITLDEEGLVHFIYQGDFTQRTSDDVFASIPQFPLPVIDTFFAFPYSAPNGMVLEYALLKSANITFACQSNFEENLELEIELPEVIHPQTGETYKYSTNLNYTGSLPVSGAGSMNLSEWNLSPDNGQLHVRYTALKANGERVALDNFFMIFSNFKASYIQGYLGNELYDLPRDTIIIDFFDNWIAGGVTFADPVMHLSVENAFGIPVRSVSNHVNIWTLDGSTLSLESDALENGIDFAYPALDEVGEVKITEFEFNNSNSNIGDLFSIKPIAVDYDLDALGNPDSDQSVTGFATDSSFFTVNMYVDLPVHGTANMFTVGEDFEMDGELGDDYDFADYIILKIISENNIPLDMGVQLYFKDSTGMVLDSLFDLPLAQIIPEKTLVSAAGVNAEGQAISTSYNEVEVELPSEKIDAFRQMRILQLVTIFNNDPGTTIKLFEEDNVNVKVGMRAGISK
jgi:hypothetical protein